MYLICFYYFFFIVVVINTVKLASDPIKPSTSSQLNQINPSSHQHNNENKKRSSSPIGYNKKFVKQIMLIEKPNEFADKSICDLVSKLRANGIEVFDPIKCDVEIWFNKFAAQLKLNDCESLASKLIQAFIREEAKEFFIYIKQKHGSLCNIDFEMLRVLFFDKFLAYRVSVVRKANIYSYDVNDKLSDYVNQKRELLIRAYPGISDNNLIIEILAGIKDKKLVKKFFPLSTNIEDFIYEVNLVECLSNEEDANEILLDFSDIESEKEEEAEAETVKSAKESIIHSFVNWVSGNKNQKSI